MGQPINLCGIGEPIIMSRMSTSSSKITNLDVKDIDYSRDTIATRFETEAPESEELDNLYDTVRKHGILEPIIVRPKGSSRYEVIAGNRRLRAAKRLKLDTIPAIVKDIDDLQARRISFIENVHRKNPNAIQKAKGIAAIYKDIGIPPEIAIMKVKHMHNASIRGLKESANNSADDSNSNSNSNDEVVKIKATPEFLEAFKQIGLSANKQYQYLQLITQIPEKVQDVVEKLNLPSHKATLLTHSRLKDKPDIKEYLAYQIADRTDDDGNITRRVSLSEAREKVRSAIQSIEEGIEMAHTARNHDIGITIDNRLTPEIDNSFEVLLYEIHDDANRLIGKILRRPLSKGEYFYERQILDPKLDSLRRNLSTVNKTERKRLGVTMAALKLVCETILDTI